MEEKIIEKSPLLNDDSLKAAEKIKNQEIETKEILAAAANKEKAGESVDLEKEKKESVLVSEKKIIVDAGLAAQSSQQAILKRQEEVIDKILSEGLNDIFLEMTKEQQKQFQEKGEETVKKITLLLREAKVKVNRIVELIKNWLKLIPGVNKFFLEQETKLKVDKIMKMKKDF